MKMKLLRVVKKGDGEQQNRLDDLQEDIWALQGAAHSMNNLFGYLSVHFNGTNKQPWRDRVLTNARNEVRDAIKEAVSSEVKKLLDDILKCYGRIKPEKDSLKSAMDRLKEIAPKVTSFINKYQKEEQNLRKDSVKDFKKNDETERDRIMEVLTKGLGAVLSARSFLKASKNPDHRKFITEITLVGNRIDAVILALQRLNVRSR